MNGYRPSFMLAIQNNTGYIFLDFDNYQVFKYYCKYTPKLRSKDIDSVSEGLVNGINHYSDFDVILNEAIGAAPSLYEVISGVLCLYWDFDGDISNSFEQLIISIKLELEGQTYCVNVYNSNGKKADGTMKYSYHVIVKGLFVKDHLICKAVTSRIIERAKSETLTKCYDDKVYTSKRNLRLLGSRKVGDSRVKVFDHCLYATVDYVSPFLNDELYMSLVVGTMNSILYDPKNIKLQPKYETLALPDDGSSNVITLSEITEVSLLVNAMYPMTFQTGLLNKGMLTMLRKKASYCDICHRTHDRNNMFVTKLHGIYYLRCFSSPKADPICLEEDNEPIEIEVRLKSNLVQERSNVQLYIECSKSASIPSDSQVMTKTVVDERTIPTKRGDVPIQSYVKQLLHIYKFA